jgi:hypothetical protein
MRTETINEPVRVRADFGNGKITPVAFKRKGRVYRVEKVNARWVDTAPESPVYYFSIDSGPNAYELSLSARDMLWRLERVILDD